MITRKIEMGSIDFTICSVNIDGGILISLNLGTRAHGVYHFIYREIHHVGTTWSNESRLEKLSPSVVDSGSTLS